MQQVKIEFVVEKTGIYGGLKRIYRLAQYFTETGHFAVVNSQDKSTAAWFSHSVPENIDLTPDIRIMPEPWQKPHPTAKNLLYVQAQFDPPEDTYDGIVTTTDYLAETLRADGFSVEAVIPYGFDSSIFTPAPDKKVKGRVAYMPRKNMAEANIVKALCPEIEFLAIDGVNEASVVEALQSSDIFMLMSRVEGFGMTGFEAALCDCLLIGYHGHGGKRWLTDDTCILATSPQEIALLLSHAILGAFENRRTNARQLVLDTLNPNTEKETWLNLLSRYK